MYMWIKSRVHNAIAFCNIAASTEAKAPHACVLIYLANTVRTNIAKLCSTPKLLAITGLEGIASTSGSCHRDLTYEHGTLAHAYAKMLQTPIQLYSKGICAMSRSAS